MVLPGLVAGEQGRADQQCRKTLAQLQFRQVGRQALAHHRTDQATTHQRKQERQLGRGPVAQSGKGHQGIGGDQQQAGAAGELHRQARQQHEGRHDREAAPHPGNAGEQAHHYALARQRQGRSRWALLACGLAHGARAAEQPGRKQSRCREDSQLHRLWNEIGLHQRAADPAAGQGRQAQHQRGFDRDLAAADVGAQIAEGQQGDHQQRKRNGGLGGQGRTAHQQGQQQNRATGSEHGEQKAN